MRDAELPSVSKKLAGEPNIKFFGRVRGGGNLQGKEIVDREDATQTHIEKEENKMLRKTAILTMVAMVASLLAVSVVMAAHVLSAFQAHAKIQNNINTDPVFRNKRKMARCYKRPPTTVLCICTKKIRPPGTSSGTAA